MDEIKVLKEKLKKKNARIKQLIARNKELQAFRDSYGWGGDRYIQNMSIRRELDLFKNYTELKYFKIIFTAITKSGARSPETPEFHSGYFIEHIISKIEDKYEQVRIINVERTA